MLMKMKAYKIDRTKNLSLGKTLLASAAMLCLLVTPLQFANGQGSGKDYSEDIENNYVQGLKDMTKELTAIGMQSITIIGQFFDAEQQMDMQQTQQKLVAEAHKEYHPNEQMCRFGTFIRSVARTEEKGKIDKQYINAALMQAYANRSDAVTFSGAEIDLKSRIATFKTTYCDIGDNNGSKEVADKSEYSGLLGMCGEDAKSNDKERINKDIDYARTVANKRTLDIDFSKPASSPDEQDILALGRHLYWPRPFESKKADQIKRSPTQYQEIRRISAIQNVAHNSYANIVALKSSSERGNAEKSGWNFMKAMFRDLGIPDKEIHQILGDYPSYDAQMEVLTKKIYQNPEFFTNLYDKPENVRRVGTSMRAIKLMQARDQFNSALRREMVLSMLIEQGLAPQVNDLSAKFR